MKKETKKTNCLVVMVKAPIEGEVKTRMIPWLGKKGAYEFYLSLLKDRMELLSNIKQAELYFACFPYEEKEKLIEVSPKDFNNIKIIPQKGKDLGERIISVLNHFDFEKNRAVLIDSDTPCLTKKVISKCFKLLENYEAVIGPSLDGGYYLIGLDLLYREIFKEIPWGSGKVLCMTIDKAKKRNIKFKLLSELQDIDTKEDVLKLFSFSRKNPKSYALSYLKDALNK